MKVLLVDQIAKVNYKYTFPLANGLEKAGAKFKLVDTLPAPAAEKLVFDDPFAARTRCVCSLVFIDVNLVNAHRPAVGRG